MIYISTKNGSKQYNLLWQNKKTYQVSRQRNLQNFKFIKLIKIYNKEKKIIPSQKNNNT